MLSNFGKAADQLALNILGFRKSRVCFKGVYPVYTDGYLHLIVLYKTGVDNSYDYRFVMRNKITKKVVQADLGRYKSGVFHDIGGKSAEIMLLDLYFAVL
jgi:hypothetical protein